MFKKFSEDDTAPLSTDQKTSDKHAVVCAHCQSYITEVNAKRIVQGAHIHTFINPAKITYSIGCYDSAPGCSPLGLPTSEHTWFAGFRWCIALCGACEIHIGWRFSGASETFYGLIISRIREQMIE